MNDRWITRNIRPITLIFFLMAILSGSVASAFGVEINPEWIGIIESCSLLVIGAYFGGRSWEKVANIKKHEPELGKENSTGAR